MLRSRYLLAVISIFCGLMLFTSTIQADLKLAVGQATGQWWNPQRDGEGFYVEVIGEGDNLQIAVAMYSYDTEGKQLWLVGNVPIDADDIGATVPVVRIEGPVWGTGYDPADKNVEQFGNIVVRFPSCDTALFNVESNVQGLESGPYSLVRLTEIVGMDCTDPPPAQEGVVTPGLWTGPEICFFVNAEGTRIVESDLCNGKAVDASVPGIQIDIDGEIDPDDCQANVACDAAWEINYGDSVTATCVNEFGGIVEIYFTSATDSVATVIEGQDLDGRMCVGEGDATPAQ